MNWHHIFHHFVKSNNLFIAQYLVAVGTLHRRHGGFGGEAAVAVSLEQVQEKMC